jgi:hypothetical protein
MVVGKQVFYSLINKQVRVVNHVFFALFFMAKKTQYGDKHIEMVVYIKTHKV